MNYEDRVTKQYFENALAEKCEVVFGSYVGNDAAERTFDLGFAPKAVLLLTSGGLTATAASSTPVTYGGLALPNQQAGPAGYPALTLTSTGFTVYNYDSFDYIRSNRRNLTYYYAALR